MGEQLPVVSLFSGAGGLDLAVMGDTGVVVDLVDHPEVIGDRCGVGEDRLALGDVERLRMGLATGGFHQSHGLRQSGGVDIAQRQAGTPLGQP